MLTIKRPSELTDSDGPIHAVVYVSKITGDCYDLDFWDDGFGPLWSYAETLGLVGIVRSKNWDDAFSAVVDEIMYDADDDDYTGDLPEGVYVRGSGQPSNPKRTSALAQEDPNGSRLERLADFTDHGCYEYFVVVEAEDEESNIS